MLCKENAVCGKCRIEVLVKRMRGRFGSVAVTAYLDDGVALSAVVMSFALARPTQIKRASSWLKMDASFTMPAKVSTWIVWCASE